MNFWQHHSAICLILHSKKVFWKTRSTFYDNNNTELTLLGLKLGTLEILNMLHNLFILRETCISQFVPIFMFNIRTLKREAKCRWFFVSISLSICEWLLDKDDSVSSLREKCPNTKFFLVRTFLYSDQKKLRIWTFFTQCFLYRVIITIKLPKDYLSRISCCCVFIWLQRNIFWS